MKHTQLLGSHHRLVVASGLLLELQLVHVDLSCILLILLHLATQQLTCDEWVWLPQRINCLVEKILRVARGSRSRTQLLEEEILKIILLIILVIE